MCKSLHLLHYLSTDSGACSRLFCVFSSPYHSDCGLLLSFKSPGTRRPKACVCRTKSTDFCFALSAALNISGVENPVEPPRGCTTDDRSTQVHAGGAAADSSRSSKFHELSNVSGAEGCVCRPDNRPVVSSAASAAKTNPIKQFQGCRVTAFSHLLTHFGSILMCPGSWNHRVGPDQDPGQPLRDRPVRHQSRVQEAVWILPLLSVRGQIASFLGSR